MTSRWSLLLLLVFCFGIISCHKKTGCPATAYYFKQLPKNPEKIKKSKKGTSRLFSKQMEKDLAKQKEKAEKRK